MGVQDENLPGFPGSNAPSPPALFLSIPRFPPGRSHERRRVFRRERTPEQVVARIIREVRRKGDAALLKFTSLLDGVQINKLELDKEAIERAYREADPILRNSLEFAAHRIRCYHQARKAEVMSSSQGLQQEIQRPLDRVGLYIPGGTASYPSTVLMTAIPAKVAGVKEIVVACPPTRDGHPPPAVLVAACIAQVDRVFNVGGVQAIAALALGTESVPRVDKGLRAGQHLGYPGEKNSCTGRWASTASTVQRRPCLSPTKQQTPGCAPPTC